MKNKGSGTISIGMQILGGITLVLVAIGTFMVVGYFRMGRPYAMLVGPVKRVCGSEFHMKHRMQAIKYLDKEELRQVLTILFSKPQEDRIIITVACGKLAAVDPHYEDFIIPYIKKALELERPLGEIPYYALLGSLGKRKSDKSIKFLTGLMQNKELEDFLHKKRPLYANKTIYECVVNAHKEATGEEIDHEYQK